MRLLNAAAFIIFDVISKIGGMQNGNDMSDTRMP